MFNRLFISLCALTASFCSKPELPPLPPGASITIYSEEAPRREEKIRRYVAEVHTTSLSGTVETLIFPNEKQARDYFEKVRPEKPAFVKTETNRTLVASETAVFLFQGSRVDTYIFYPPKSQYQNLPPDEKEAFQNAVLQFAKELTSSFS